MAQGSPAASSLIASTYLARLRSSHSKVDPAIEAMADIGIDIYQHRSKSVDEIDPTGIDLVGALSTPRKSAPVFPEATRRLRRQFRPASAGTPDDARARVPDGARSDRVPDRDPGRPHLFPKARWRRSSTVHPRRSLPDAFASTLGCSILGRRNRPLAMRRSCGPISM